MVGMKHIQNQLSQIFMVLKWGEVQNSEGRKRQRKKGKRETHQGNIIAELWFSSEESHDAISFNVLATVDKHR
jgi:hypothetical protein